MISHFFSCLKAFPCYPFDDFGILARVFYHLSEESASQQQLVRSFCLYDPASVHHEHLVVVGDRVEPVRDGDDGGLPELGLDAVLDEVVGHHVHVRSGLVEHQELVLPQQRAGQAEQLFLSH